MRGAVLGGSSRLERGEVCQLDAEQRTSEDTRHMLSIHKVALKPQINK
eukprot:COSAG02_NODE_4361_length_5453_cov_2.128689_2_plen_48_part_00